MLYGYITHILCLIGTSVLLGLVLYALDNALVSMLGKSGKGIYKWSGIIGTPVHELSHAVACLVFGHTVKSVNLFNFNSKNGTLGYVSHTYNKRNVYHQVGNYFIAVAPLYGCTLLSAIIMMLLVPGVFSGFRGVWYILVSSNHGILDVDTYMSVGKAIALLFKTLFLSFDITSLRFWLFVIICLPITMHASLSPADIRSGMCGAGILALVTLAFDLLLFFVSKRIFAKFTSFAVSVSAYITVFALTGVAVYIIVIMLVLIVYLLAFIVRAIFDR